MSSVIRSVIVVLAVRLQCTSLVAVRSRVLGRHWNWLLLLFTEVVMNKEIAEMCKSFVISAETCRGVD